MRVCVCARARVCVVGGGLHIKQTVSVTVAIVSRFEGLLAWRLLRLHYYCNVLYVIMTDGD